MKTRAMEVEKGGGNVFADLGLPNAEDRLAKAELARKINEIISRRGLNQIDAAELLGIDQPRISALARGRLAGFSLERLVRFLNILGRDVRILVKPKPKGRHHAMLSVV